MDSPAEMIPDNNEDNIEQLKVSKIIDEPPVQPPGLVAQAAGLKADQNKPKLERKPSFKEKFWSKFSKDSAGQARNVENGTDQNQAEGKKDKGSWFQRKKEEPEVAVADTDSEDVFPSLKKKQKDEQTNVTKGKKSKNYKTKEVKLDDSIRIKVWVRRNQKEPFRPAKFCGCLVDYFAEADQRNIYSAPSFLSSNNLLQIPKLNSRSVSPIFSETASLKSSSGYSRSTRSLNVPFLGCCSSGRNSARYESEQPSTPRVGMKTEAISVTVECLLQDNRVLMQPAPIDDLVDRPHSKLRQSRRRPGAAAVSYVTILEHPPFCSAHRLTPKAYDTLTEETKKRGVDVGVSVLLESSDQKILITRRAQNMRTFPGVWVPPGGHVEDRETPLQAGMRELKEETGLQLERGAHVFSIVLKLPPQGAPPSSDSAASKNSSAKRYYDTSDDLPEDDSGINKYSMLGLWESCYPPVMYAGQPQRQHLVYYIHIQVSQHSDDIQQCIKLERTEVGASAWIDRSHAEVVAYSHKPLPDSPLAITVLDKETDTMSQGTMDPKVLRKKMPEPTREIERLTTGTRYALKLWLALKEQDDADTDTGAL